MTAILAFTADNVCKLTGLSARQLHYWDATDFFSPEYIDEHKRRAFGRIYSFRDVVGLRTIALLRNKHRVPLQELRRVGEWLKTQHGTPWSSLRLGLAGRAVVFSQPSGEVYREAKGGGQIVIDISLEVIANDMSQAADALRQRRGDQIGAVARNRYVVHNAWVLAGTRIPTQAVWNFHEAGYSAEAIIAEYPRLTPKDVHAAIEFEAGRQNAA